jgi:DNA-binding response OmpR family regulator
MVQNPERGISRPEFLDTIWSYRNELGTRAVDSHIRNLRRNWKADPAKPIHLRTVRCVGCMFIPQLRRLCIGLNYPDHAKETRVEPST